MVVRARVYVYVHVCAVRARVRLYVRVCVFMGVRGALTPLPSFWVRELCRSVEYRLSLIMLEFRSRLS